MRRSLTAKSLLAGLAFLAATASTPATAQTAERVTATHGDWEVVCASGAGAQEVCAIRQVGRDSAGKEVLVVTVRALSGVTSDDGQPVPAAIDIVAPLGVALRAGVRVTIDGGQERAAPFDICIANGCLVRSPMGGDFLAEMKRGSSATMKIAAPQQGEITVTISLRGFTAAFGDL